MLKPRHLPLCCLLALASSCARDPDLRKAIEAGRAHDKLLNHAETLGTWLVGEFETGAVAANEALGSPATLRIVRLPEFGRGFYAESWCSGRPADTIFQDVLISTVEDGVVRLERWRIPNSQLYIHVWEKEPILARTGMYDIRERPGCAFNVTWDEEGETYSATLDCATCQHDREDGDLPAVLRISRQGIEMETCVGLTAGFARLSPIDETRPTP